MLKPQAPFVLLVAASVFLSGCFGQFVYTRVPGIITRIEGEKSLLVEDVVNERSELERELAGLCDTPPLKVIAAV